MEYFLVILPMIIFLMIVGNLAVMFKMGHLQIDLCEVNFRDVCACIACFYFVDFVDFTLLAFVLACFNLCLYKLCQMLTIISVCCAEML